jgi:outer membrane protein assembly factor BamB
MATRICLLTIIGTVLFLNGAITHAQTNWPTFGFDQERTGYNPQETILSTQTIPSLTLQWSVNLGGPITAQPIAANGLVYAATWAGMIYAVDPLSGSIVWSKQLGVTQSYCYEDFVGGIVGIIGTPTVDTSNGRIFVVSGDDLLHSLDPGTGNELQNYPLRLLGAANNAPRTFVYGSPTYNPANNSLYLATASACDTPPYHGQVMRVDVTPGAAPKVLRRWFVDGSSGPDGGGIWGPGGLSLGPYDKALFTATGNALADPENQFYADHVVRLGLGLSVEAANSPSDLGNQANDSDFGSTPMLYHPPGCPPLLAVLNKNGSLYVYNRNAIGNGPIQELYIVGFAFIGAAAYDPSLKNVYVTSNADDGVGVFFHGIIALSVQSDCTLALAWQQQIGFNDLSATIPAIAANGVVYAPTGGGSSVFAFDGSSGQYLWDTGGFAQGGVFAPPMVVNGQLFVADFTGDLLAFAPVVGAARPSPRGH